MVLEVDPRSVLTAINSSTRVPVAGESTVGPVNACRNRFKWMSEMLIKGGTTPRAARWGGPL